MSAERECFKKMEKLIAEKNLFLGDWYERARKQVEEAIVEFMLDHPEVDALRWQQFNERITTKEHDPARILYLSVSLNGEQPQKRDGSNDWITSKDLVEFNPKLSICLDALKTNFSSMLDVLFSLYSYDVEIEVLNRGKESLKHLKVHELW